MIPVVRIRIAQIALVVWAGLCLVGGGALLVFHLAALPVPPVDDPALAAALRVEQADSERGRWRIVHILYARCPCSQQVVELLTAPDRRARFDDANNVRERVVIIDPTPQLAERLQRAGFLVQSVSAGDLKARWHVESAPLVVIADDQGRVRSVGGYTHRKDGPLHEPLQMLEQLRRGDALAALPLFGCATSQELQRAVDPLRIKALTRALAP